MHKKNIFPDKDMTKMWTYECDLNRSVSKECPDFWQYPDSKYKMIHSTAHFYQLNINLSRFLPFKPMQKLTTEDILDSLQWDVPNKCLKQLKYFGYKFEGDTVENFMEWCEHIELAESLS